MGINISSLPSVLKRRSLPALATFASVIGASIAYLVTTPPVFRVSSRLILDNKQVSVSELGRDLSQVSSGTPGGPGPLGDQAELVRSERLFKRAVNKVIPQEPESSQGEEVMESLDDNLNVKIVPAANILELSYEDQDPALATKILNAVSEAMVEENTEALRSEAKAVREFLEREVPKRRVAAQAAEVAESKYRQTSGIISFEEQATSLVSSLATLEDQERTLSAQLEEARTRVKKLRQITDNSTPQSAYAAGRIGQDEELKDLRVKLAELETKLSNARSRFTDNNPAVSSLLRERDSLLALYNDKVSRILPSNEAVPPANIASDQLSQNLTSEYITAETERLALEEKLSLLQEQKQQLKQRIAQLPVKQQPLTPLIREREEATTSLKLLQSKLEEARIAEAQLVGNIRIIEQAKEPSSPAGPNQKAVLVIATVFGSMLAVGVMLILELLDDRLHEAIEVEELLKLPTLGVLPDIPKVALSLEEPDYFLDNSGLVEPYRRLLKTLEFRRHEKFRLIVVSSTISGEGKSLVVSHLAAVSAMLSRRTLIIDADLHQPRQHRLLNIPQEPGLADVIDKNINFLHAVQPTNIDNLSILTCGELCDGASAPAKGYRPAALLESPLMKSLLEEASAHYDLVIVDTPPVSNCADANALSQSSDGLVMVVRPNFTPKGMLRQTVTELTGNGVPILGVIVNGIKNRNQKRDRYPVKSNPHISKSLNYFPNLGNPVNNSAKH